MHYCIFHWGSLWQAFPRSMWTLLWRILRQLPILQASSAGGRETVSTCDFKGKPGSFSDCEEFATSAEKQGISWGACLQGSWWGIGTPCSLWFPNELRSMRKEHVPRKVATAEGPLATFASRESGWGLWIGLIPSERQKEVNYFQMKMVVGEYYEGRRVEATLLGPVMQRCPCCSGDHICLPSI